MCLYWPVKIAFFSENANLQFEHKSGDMLLQLFLYKNKNKQLFGEFWCKRLPASLCTQGGGVLETQTALRRFHFLESLNDKKMLPVGLINYYILKTEQIGL